MFTTNGCTLIVCVSDNECPFVPSVTVTKSTWVPTSYAVGVQEKFPDVFRLTLPTVLGVNESWREKIGEENPVLVMLKVTRCPGVTVVPGESEETPIPEAGFTVMLFVALVE